MSCYNSLYNRPPSRRMQSRGFQEYETRPAPYSVPDLGDVPEQRVLSQMQAQQEMYGGRDVFQLTPDNFDQFTEDNPENFLLYGAKWCSHCRDFSPIYGEIATQLKRQKKPQKLAAIDCAEHEDFCRAQNITSYPTIRTNVRAKGKQYKEYNGERSKAALQQYFGLSNQ